MTIHRSTRCGLLLILFLLLSLLHSSYADIRTIKLHGSSDKSSYDSIKDLILAYKLTEPNSAFTMTASGSADVISAMAAKKEDFGISIQGWSDAVAATAPDLNMLPLFLTGFVPVYRIDSLGVNAPPVTFTRNILVCIFTAECTRWDHPLIVAANRLLTMPALNITMIFERNAGARNWLVKNALYQFNETAMRRSGMQISNRGDYPTARYAVPPVRVESSVTSLVTGVIANDGSFALAFHSVAANLAVSMGSMVNKANKTVQFNEDSITFAAIEKAIVKPPTRTTAHVLTDPESESAWPLALFAYVLVDTQSSSSSCKARELLSRFFLNVYQNPIALNIVRSRNMAPIPDLILKQSGAVDLLSTKLMCRGTAALPMQLTNKRTISVAESFLFPSKLFTSVYQDQVSSVAFEPKVSPDMVMISQLVNSEVDIILVTPSFVEQNTWKELVASSEFLVLPLIGQAPTLFVNPEITPDINLGSAGKDLVLDMNSLIGLVTGCINDYNNADLQKLNPWLPQLLGNMSAPIFKVNGCGKTIQDAPLATFFSALVTKVATTAPQLLNPQMFPCLLAKAATQIAWEECKGATPTDMFVRNEMLAPLLASGMNGGLAYHIADADDQKMYPLLQRVVNGKTGNAGPFIDNVMLCADGTFSQADMWFYFDKSVHPGCWQFTQQMVAVVRKQYYSTTTNTSSCTRGIDALRFLRWFIMSEAVDMLSANANIAQLANSPGIEKIYLDSLDAVLCDDDRLLITLPTIWDLDENVLRLGIACAVIGMMFTIGLIGAIICYHKHPIMRASSPPFMLISMAGILVMFGAVIAMVSPISATSCNAFSWMVNMGFTLTFVPLFAKIFRVYLIFGRKKLAVVKINNRKLFVLVVAATAADIIFCTIWQVISPLQPYLSIESNGSPPRETHYLQCGVEGDGIILIAADITIFIMICLVGSLMAFRIRRVTSQFNESSQVALAIYNVLFTLGILAAVLVVIEARGDIQIGLMLFGLIWIAFFTVCILVVPKIMHIRAKDEGTQEDKNMTTSSNGFSFMSLDVLDSLPMVGSYIAALRRHLEAVEQKQVTLKKAQNGNQHTYHPTHQTAVTPLKSQLQLQASPLFQPLTTPIRSPIQSGTLRRPSHQTTASVVKAATSADAEGLGE